MYVLIMFSPGLHQCISSWPGVEGPSGPWQTPEHDRLPHKTGGLHG